MTTLKYVGDYVIDSTGPLRKMRLPDGLDVVGEQMLIAVESEEAADEVMKELKSEYGVTRLLRASPTTSAFPPAYSPKSLWSSYHYSGG
jgi:hypothetical protein